MKGEGIMREKTYMIKLTSTEVFWLGLAAWSALKNMDPDVESGEGEACEKGDYKEAWTGIRAMIPDAEDEVEACEKEEQEAKPRLALKEAYSADEVAEMFNVSKRAVRPRNKWEHDQMVTHYLIMEGCWKKLDQVYQEDVRARLKRRKSNG